jgi:hypothetical protein
VTLPLCLFEIFRSLIWFLSNYNGLKLLAAGPSGAKPHYPWDDIGTRNDNPLGLVNKIAFRERANEKKTVRFNPIGFIQWLLRLSD